MTERPALLTNPRSDRVRMVRRLAGRSARRRHAQFLVEGPQAVREAVGHAAEWLRDLYLTPEAAQRYPQLAPHAGQAGCRVHLASREVLDEMSADAQGLLAVAHVPAVVPTLDELLGTELVAVLAEASDPGNLGTMIRAADAAGSLFHLPVLNGAKLDEVLPEVRSRGWQVLAADGKGRWDLDDLADAAARGKPPVAAGPDLRRPTAWLLGNEAHGLQGDQLVLADAVVRVPLYGLAESLNVAAAAAVCLYASARAQRPARGYADNHALAESWLL